MDAAISIHVESQGGAAHSHTPSCMLMWGEVQLLRVYSYL